MTNKEARRQIDIYLDQIEGMWLTIAETARHIQDGDEAAGLKYMAYYHLGQLATEQASLHSLQRTLDDNDKFSE